MSEMMTMIIATTFLLAFVKVMASLLSILGHSSVRPSNRMINATMECLQSPVREALALLLLPREGDNYISHIGGVYGLSDTGEEVGIF